METGAFLGVETGPGPYRRIYRITLEAMKPLILSCGIVIEAGKVAVFAFHEMAPRRPSNDCRRKAR